MPTKRAHSYPMHRLLDLIGYSQRTRICCAAPCEWVRIHQRIFWERADFGRCVGTCGPFETSFGDIRQSCVTTHQSRPASPGSFWTYRRLHNVLVPDQLNIVRSVGYMHPFIKRSQKNELMLLRSPRQEIVHISIHENTTDSRNIATGIRPIL